MNSLRRAVAQKLLFATITAGLLAAPCAQAQDVQAWPTKPVRVVVPYAPGGSSDTLGRLIAKLLADTFKQPFVVDNKAGASGSIGSNMVARTDPDGYTLVVSGIGSHVVAPFANPVPYDPMKDFTHIAILGGPPTVLAVNASVPVKNVAEFIAYVRKQPQGVSFGSPGQGTHGSLIGEAFRQVTKVDLVQIAYKGASPAVADVTAGQVPAAFVTLTTAGQQIKSGRLRALAVTSSERVADFPDVPTFKELGYPQLTGTTWFSLSGPAGMAPDLVSKINTAVRAALKTPEGKAALKTENMETFDWDAPTFTKYFQSEIDHWGPYVKASAQSTAK